MVLVTAVALAGTVAAQPALVADPNPFDGLAHDTITVRNAGEVAVPLDSMRFASSIPEHGTSGWYFHLRGWFADGFRQGWVVCDPGTHFQCATEFYGEVLAPGDSLRIERPRTYCALCRNRPLLDQARLFDDTLRVYAGAQALPLEVIIVDGKAIPGVEEGADGRPAAPEIYPNPTSGPATLRVTNASAGEVVVRVVDTAGRLVRSGRQFTAAPGSTELPLALGGLPAGVYHVAVEFPGRPGGAGARVVVTR